jgi:two-component system, sensor histidine kinase and response regulator
MIDQGSRAPVRVLIVDDTPEDRVAYKRLLQGHASRSFGGPEFDVDEADSASEGLEKVRTWAPDCVLLDYRLPDMTGIEFLGELAGQAGHGGLAVVMLTGQGDEMVARDAIKCGAQDYLVKGQLSAEALQESIYNAVEMCTLRRMVERQRRQLERSNRELERYARVVAHDLEAPLNAIRQGLKGLQQRAGARLDTESADFVAEALESAQRMGTLIRDILAYSRATAHAAPFSEVDTNAAADTALANLKVPIESTQASIAVEHLPQVMGDEAQFVQLFQNLIGNAIKYRHSERRPEIRVWAEPEGEDRWRFAVTDNGMGIDPAHSDRIFEPFIRLHPASEIEGTGVGLAICRAVVERHGGQLWVQSRPGEGSTFYFSMPAAKSTPRLTASAPPSRN